MKQFIILLILISFQFDCICQVSIWINAGINYSNLDTRLYSFRRPNYEYSYKPFLGVGAEYMADHLIFRTGIALAQRGTKYNTNVVFFPNKYFTITYTYLEIPVLVSYFFESFHSGIQSGIVFHKRIETNSVEYGERNYVYGSDIRIGMFWKPLSKIQLDLYYTLGNFDKIIFEVGENNVHQIFSLGVSYRIYKFCN